MEDEQYSAVSAVYRGDAESATFTAGLPWQTASESAPVLYEHQWTNDTARSAYAASARPTSSAISAWPSASRAAYSNDRYVAAHFGIKRLSATSSLCQRGRANANGTEADTEQYLSLRTGT